MEIPRMQHGGDRVRVIDLETAGNGPNDVCEIGWQDVVLDADGRWHVNDERGSLLVNPGRPISPETMAVHHILDVEVAGAPLWKAVASSVLHPDGGVIALAAHRAASSGTAPLDYVAACHGSAPGNAP